MGGYGLGVTLAVTWGSFDALKHSPHVSHGCDMAAIWLDRRFFVLKTLKCSWCQAKLIRLRSCKQILIWTLCWLVSALLLLVQVAFRNACLLFVRFFLVHRCCREIVRALDNTCTLSDDCLENEVRDSSRHQCSCISGTNIHNDSASLPNVLTGLRSTNVTPRIKAPKARLNTRSQTRAVVVMIPRLEVCALSNKLMRQQC